MNELKGKRIVIIEDNMMNMAVFSATLRRSGAVILQDIWNKDAELYLLQSLPVDIILLDLMLRDRLSGYDVFLNLKKYPKLAHIPVVAVTASDPTIEMPKAKSYGFAGFIGKPIIPRLFPVQIADIIGGKEIWANPQDVLEEL